jgi:hypothetical protein
MKEDNMSEQDIKPELLDGRIEALEEYISEMEDMLENDDSVPPSAMEMYERNLAASKQRLDGLKGFRDVLGDLDG